MSGTEPDPDIMTPAERRLLDVVAVLRGEGPDNPMLAPRVIHTARWQRAVRVPLAAMGRLAGTVADGFGLLAGIGNKRDAG